MKRLNLLSVFALTALLIAGFSDSSVTKEAPTYQVSQEFNVIDPVQVYTPVYASTSVDVMHSEVLSLDVPELGSPVAKFGRVTERSVKGYLVTNKAPPRYRC